MKVCILYGGTAPVVAPVLPPLMYIHVWSLQATWYVQGFRSHIPIGMGIAESLHQESDPKSVKRSLLAYQVAYKNFVGSTSIAWQ